MSIEKDTQEEQQSSSKKKVLYFIFRNLPRLVLLCLVLLIFSLVGTIGNAKKQLDIEKASTQGIERKLVNTILLELQPEQIKDAINLPGTIEPWTSLTLMAKVSGAISEVLVQEGSAIHKGQVLARIEPDDYRIALDAAKAAYTLAKADYERDREMLHKRVISAASLQSSETRLQTALAELEKAKLQLSRCTITAPMNGVVKRLDAKIGLYLSVGDPLAQLLQIDRVKAVVGIPESDVDAIRRIDVVDLTVQALGAKDFVGKKYFLSPAPDTSAYLYRLELALDNPEHHVLPGMFFRAHIIKQRVDEALAVPLYAVISRNDEQFVFVVEDGKVRKQSVKLGIIEKWQVEVTEGLEPGDQVVIEGHRDVEHGQQVKVIKVVSHPTERLL